MKTFVLTGSAMRNKGSQAMLFTMINGLKKRYEGCRIVFFTNDPNDLKEANDYNFEILPWDYHTIRYVFMRMNHYDRLVTSSAYDVARKYNEKIIDVLESADLIFDVSGYQLGSRWGYKITFWYLANIEIAKRFGLPLYLMPQSIGPFKWKNKRNKFIRIWLRKVIKYPDIIFCRETEGYGWLDEFKVKRKLVSPDLVIQEEEFALPERIFSDNRQYKKIQIPTNSVGIILNEHVVKRGNRDTVISLYVQVIERLLNSDKQPVLLKTSTADDRLVEEVIKNVRNSKELIVINDIPSCIELCDAMQNFDYIVGSRYHSIIFGYRHGVPAVIVGWAEKYMNLAKYFGQENYVVDLETWDENQIINNMELMREHYSEESEKIKKALKVIQENSVFSILEQHELL